MDAQLATGATQEARIFSGCCACAPLAPSTAKANKPVRAGFNRRMISSQGRSMFSMTARLTRILAGNRRSWQVRPLRAQAPPAAAAFLLFAALLGLFFPRCPSRCVVDMEYLHGVARDPVKDLIRISNEWDDTHTGPRGDLSGHAPIRRATVRSRFSNAADMVG